MNIIKPGLLFLTFTIFNTNSFAQTKEDLVDCFVVLFQQPEMEEIIKVQEEEFGEIIIRKPHDRRYNARPEEEMFFQLENDDFWNISYPVRVLTQKEIERTQIDQRKLLNIGFNFIDQRILIVSSIWLEETRRTITGHFLFEKNNGDWVIVNKNLDER